MAETPDTRNDDRFDEELEASRRRGMLLVAVGLGGLVLAFALVSIALIVVGATRPREDARDARRALVTMQAVALESRLAAFLEKDEARLGRASRLALKLNEAAERGRISSDEVEALNRELDRLTDDHALEPAEADRMLAAIEGALD